MLIIGIDPGTHKLGVAVFNTERNSFVKSEIVDLRELQRLLESSDIKLAVCGSGTGCKKVFSILNSLKIPFTVVKEENTTVMANERLKKSFWGWIKLIFGNVDDEVAKILVELFLKNPEKYLNCKSHKPSNGCC